jgi:selenocysteine lyase/cysteine desulfurase
MSAMLLHRRSLLGLAAGAVGAGVTPPATALTQSSDPLGVRADFPAARTSLYLNAAYITPSPTPVVEAAAAFLERKRTRPIPLGEMMAKTADVRVQAARLLNATPDEIGFVSATSDGENLVAGAADLQRGDNVVIDALHYNTEFVLYRQLEATRGIELRIVPARDGAVPVDDVARMVNRRTKIVSVAWVSHQNGYRHDLRALADLAHANGALLYADVIQGVGTLALDIRASGVDCAAAGTYKWLLGGFAPAIVYVRREILDRVRPDRYGHLHVAREHPGYRYDLFTNARKFEHATLPFAEIYQLGAGLTYLERVGISRIEGHVVGLADRLSRGLVERGVTVLTPRGTRSAIIAIRNPSASEAAARALLDKGDAQVSYRDGGQQIRISPALYNTAEDIDRFLGLVEQLLGSSQARGRG